MKNDPCWKGYEMVGTKKKRGKTVPNCVPVKEAARSIIEKAKEKIRIDKGLEDELMSQRAGPDGKAWREKKKKEVSEARGSDYTLYHKSYTDAINHALSHHEKSGLKVSEDDRFQHVSVGSKKPSEGNTTSLHIPATHTSGKKHLLHIQVYNKGGSHPYELNTYSSTSRDLQKEERGEDSKGHYRATEDGAGLTRKGAKAMGVKTAVTTPPSKLDPDGKAAKRRKSFCARMGGMKGPMKDEKGRPTRKAMSLRRWNCNEELGRENEWGRPELRKKFAAMTPGQEGLAADEIPSFDPRYDDVTTQYCGGIKEDTLNEISALGAKKRSEFAAKLQKTLADPKKIAKAKKEIAKKKAVQKAEEPKHLVMQLRKASSIGSKVKFYDGSEHHVAPNHVEKFNDRYHSLKSSIEKESLIKRAHKSHADFMRAISEETEMGQPEAPCTCDITLANYPTPSQLSPQPELGDINGDGMTNEWDEAAIEAEVSHEIETSDWDHLEQYYEDEEAEAIDEDYYPRAGFPKEGDYGYHPNPGLKPQESDKDQDMDKAYKVANGEEAKKPLNATVTEAITPQGRLKKKFAAMRNKTRRNLAKNMALKRIATPDRIKDRSIRAARRMVYKRILRNRDPSSVSAAEKARIEAQVKRMAPMVSRLSIRLQQAERKRDQARVINSRTRKK